MIYIHRLQKGLMVTMDEKEVITMLMEVMKTNMEMYKQREETDRMTLETMRYMDKNHNNSIVRIIHRKRSRNYFSEIKRKVLIK